MQNRYAGDVGDFMKFGLLRHLAASVGADTPGLSFGLNWYLVPDEGHNADGKHITYLRVDHRHHKSLRACDADLMRCLAEAVSIGRTVEALEACGALPAGARTYHDVLNPGLGRAGRRDWHRRALDALTGCDIVFADPDNGILPEARGSKLHKFALVEELADYAARGQSLVVYHHHDRSAHRESHARRRLAELAAGVHQTPVAAVIARRGTCRFFLITATEQHLDDVADGVRDYARRWAPHAELVMPDPSHAELSNTRPPRPDSLVAAASTSTPSRSASCPPESRRVALPAMSSGAGHSRSRAGQGKTVQIGYRNRNGQSVIATTGLPGTDHMQLIYVLRCGQCGHQYGSNGSDNFQRKCPQCQGGARGLRYS